MKKRKKMASIFNQKATMSRLYICPLCYVINYSFIISNYSSFLSLFLASSAELAHYIFSSIISFIIVQSYDDGQPPPVGIPGLLRWQWRWWRWWWLAAGGDQEKGADCKDNILNKALQLRALSWTSSHHHKSGRGRVWRAALLHCGELRVAVRIYLNLITMVFHFLSCT